MSDPTGIIIAVLSIVIGTIVLYFIIRTAVIDAIRTTRADKPAAKDTGPTPGEARLLGSDADG